VPRARPPDPTAMPILTSTEPSGKRHTPPWLMVSMALVVPLVVVFAWSWFQPVNLGMRGRGVFLGYSRGDSATTGFHTFVWGPDGASGLALRLPGNPAPGAYIVAYYW
jgi:hypothetical protein